jgi:hypothetical protein
MEAYDAKTAFVLSKAQEPAKEDVARVLQGG